MLRRYKRKAVLMGLATVASVLLAYSATHWADCSYYGYQTNRDTRYAPFVGCMVKIGEQWVPREELRVVQ